MFKDPKNTTAGKKVPGITVYCKRDNFRRCGRVFGSEPVQIPLGELKAAPKRGEPSELDILKADPMLVVVECEIVVPEAPAEA